ncbi:sigma-54-dependent transcriptional regulator [Oceanomicrobium pacificus]|uniref:Nif-specific regulatory protein n=1 Tax=Oceanomicrobium pacificus TaxID=2692916 RepID=A0A6B0TR71_9RHOB|nr:sigma-54 dependent transcriptional regulator [Oceanomicrobium pacificus]MXU64295.1 response regulator [Oceanomicrobium pacificus]
MSMIRHAFVIDDDRAMRGALEDLLTSAGWKVTLFAGIDKAARALPSDPPDVILSDMRMPGGSGLDLLESLRDAPSAVPPVILISAHGDIPLAVEAMQAGAYSFLEKPFDPRRLLTVLDHAADQARLGRDNARLRARLARLGGLDRLLVGDSPTIRDLRREVLDLADAPLPVMVLGETGTGKDLVARALHDLSDRAAGPFIALNCAALPADHFEAGIFGRVGGDSPQQGAFARADGGTLFLDEVTACPIDLQPKLLRALDTQEVTPVGSDSPRRVDIRILSASNEALDRAVAENRLREDLMFRLNAVELHLPPLRERGDDIVLLFTRFMAEQAEVLGSDMPELTPEDIAAMLAHDWPGNVRELRNVAARTVLARRRAAVPVADILSPGGDLGDMPATLREAVAAFERQMIARALRAEGGRMDAVADALGIGRRTLNEKIVKLGLHKDELL